MAYLDVKDLTIKFGGITAVDNVSFEVEKGEIFSIIGPNGAGKTTIFNLLTGVYTPTSGEIYFKDKPIHGLSPQQIVESGISRTFQNIRLYPNRRILNNVMMGMHSCTSYGFFSALFRTKKFREEEAYRTDEALRILESVQLVDRASDYADNLAYGQQRKLEIARAIATCAELILLDEPAAGMNPHESADLLRFIRSLRDQGFTIILIEHDMSVVMNISDRVCVIDHGKHLITDVPTVVSRDPRVIEAYLGASEDETA